MRRGHSTRHETRTLRNRLDVPTPSCEIRASDTNEHAESHDANPPPNRVASEVDLLLLVVISPEADTVQQERPVDGPTGVRVRCSQASIVLQHQKLQLSELDEEIHLLHGLRLGWSRAVHNLVAVLDRDIMSGHDKVD